MRLIEKLIRLNELTEQAKIIRTSIRYFTSLSYGRIHNIDRGMHTTIIYEYYDENGDLIDTLNIKRELPHKHYLGQIDDSTINNLVVHLNKRDIINLDKKSFLDYGIELLNTYSYYELRGSVALIYLQFMINIKDLKDEI